jgi:hypothetical protein
MRWEGHVACTGDKRNVRVYTILVGNPEGREPLRRPGRKWEDNIKKDLRETRSGGMPVKFIF